LFSTEARFCFFFCSFFFFSFLYVAAFAPLLWHFLTGVNLSVAKKKQFSSVLP